jgi:hypothetical protein
MIRNIIIAFVIIFLFVLLFIYPNASHAQTPHHHPTETIYGPRAEFYRTWHMPDAPGVSCCSDRDCYVTRTRYRGGKIQAIHRESADWIDIPPEKIELNRDSPDGLSHMCASPLKYVFCFKEGGGT